ncbi:MAG TPA: AAA family ATPase [Candidatus Nanoarchaeia archaeon]|nr:AAA family ATPase [Candidatus Nanoarchaeia archaeon]
MKVLDFLNKNINCIYGIAGTGKTTLAMMKAIELAKKGKSSFIIDSENGFSIERFKQLAGKDYEKFLDKIMVAKVKSFKEQHNSIKQLLKIKDKFSLVIVDTITGYYRRLVNSKAELANKMLIAQMKMLNSISRYCSVIVVSQVSSSLEKNEVRPVGGKILFNDFNNLIELKKSPRKLVLMPSKDEFLFEIKDEGIVLK